MDAPPLSKTSRLPAPGRPLGIRWGMLANDLSECAQGARLPIVGSHPPHERARRLVDDGDDTRVPAADDDVVRMEAPVARVVPLIGSKIRGGIHVQPVAAATILGPRREAVDGIARLL